MANKNQEGSPDRVTPFIDASHRSDLLSGLVQNRQRQLTKALNEVVKARLEAPLSSKKDGKDGAFDGIMTTGKEKEEPDADPLTTPKISDKGKDSSDKGKDTKDIKESKEGKDKEDKEPDSDALNNPLLERQYAAQYGAPDHIDRQGIAEAERIHSGRMGRLHHRKPII